jgi:diguanylate cyclase (GGDEF)-like protein/PAS domain S-box-containing protein
MGQLRRWAPLGVSLVLLVGLGVFGFSIVASSRDAAEATLRDSTLTKQRTVAALADQYLKLAAKEAFEFAAAHEIELTPGSPADTELLEKLLAKRGGLFNYAAVLSDLKGQPLTVVTRSAGIPNPDDPGYAPLRASLVQGRAGVSSLMLVDDIPIVAIGVPILRDERPLAVLVAYFRTDTSHLQRYSAHLGRDSDAIGMVVDSAGTVVAARDPDLIGGPVPRSPARDAITHAEAGNADFRRDGVAHVATYAPIQTGGWMLVEEQPADTFYAPVRNQSQTAQLALLGLLVAGAISAVILNHRTDLTRRRGEQRSQALVEDASDVIIIMDTAGKLSYASPPMERILGFRPADLVGRHAMELVHPEDLTRARAAVSAAAGSPERRQRIQARVVRADDSYCPCELVISNQADNPAVDGIIVSVRDITELVALHDQLSHQALHDPLTDLPNRTRLEQRMSETLATCGEDRRIAALFLDLDGFKPVNDRFGHERGDEILIEVAARLRRATRDGDTVARLGGDEFVIVLSSAEPEEHARRIAHRVLELMAQPFQLGHNEVHVGASIGIAISTGDTAPDVLLREADAAMYLAKERGRFRYEFWSGRDDALPLVPAGG